MRKTDFGYYAEGFVCSSLEKDGYEIIRRNYRVRGGEIDIIAVKDIYICFVEVKYRTDGSSFETAIDRKKQRRIVKSAEEFMRKTGCELQPRFDAAFVSPDVGDSLSLEYIPNAFDGSGI